MIIREWDEADIERVLAITVAAWRPVYNGYLQAMGPEIFEAYHSDWEERKRQTVMRSCQGINGVSVYVVEVDGTVAAFVGYQLDAARQCGLIYDNAVDPDYQGRGIAVAMYKFVLERMREQGMKFASVTTGGDAAHIPARKSYEKSGFSRSIPSVRYYMDLLPESDGHN
jgi:GNAT superfamily N-acetyltransferase